MLKGRSSYKMEGTSPNHRPLASHKGKKDCSDDLNLNSISPPAFLFFLPRFLFLCLSLALDDKSGANKDSVQSNQANSANKLSVGSSLSVLTLSTVSVAKQRLKCLATRRHSILMEWLPHARLPCAWSLRLQKKKIQKNNNKSNSEERWGEDN